MPALPLRLGRSAAALAPGFDGIRSEMLIPEAFSPAAEAEARRGTIAAGERRDRRDIPLITIDPAGSRDLDQALAIGPHGDGHRVHYAIADVAAFVTPDGGIDADARERGVTIYMPDRRTPLHPLALSEDGGSLLPGRDRPVLLWTIDLDGAGHPVSAEVERALVRSRRALGYIQAQAEIDAGSSDDTLRLLPEVGRRRIAVEAGRGGVSLTIPAQEVVRDGRAYVLRYETTLPVEDWNAQISLLTGICAARMMVDGGVGLFRTLEAADPRDLESLRRSGLALGVTWPAGARYADVVRSLDPTRPTHAAFAVRATRLFRGAGYAAWRRIDGAAPPGHAAIASLYAHVTAPLRRLADRFANEIVVALCAGVDPPAWAAEALTEIPAIMASTVARERRAGRAAIDLVECAILAGRVGEAFPGMVIDVRDGRATVQLSDPAVVAPLDDVGAVAGDLLSVRLQSADAQTRQVRFTRA